jgi:hypothetical protein
MAYLLGVPVSPDSDDVAVFEVESSEVHGELILASDEPDKMADRARISLEEVWRN